MICLKLTFYRTQNSVFFRGAQLCLQQLFKGVVYVATSTSLSEPQENSRESWASCPS